MTEWQQLFSNLDQLFTSVSTLLMDCDGMLEKRGFRVAHKPNSFGCSQRSYDLGSPTWWYPRWVSRAWLQVGKQLPESVFLDMAVLLSPRDGEDLPKLDEPVLCAGAWHYTPDSSPSWDWWMAKAWGWGDAEGRPLNTEVTRNYNNGNAKATGTVFALPLSQIQDSTQLEKQVIERLVKNAKL